MTLDLRNQILTLVKLQVLDTEIYVLRSEKNALPQQIEAIDAAFQQQKQHLADLEKMSLDLQKLKKDKELELAGKEEGAKKLQGQLYSLKTNKEYQTMLQQIQDSKADASVIEDQILEILEKIDVAKQDVEAEKIRLKGQEKVFDEQKRKVEIRVKEIDDRLAQLDSQRKQIVPALDAKVLAQYERILANRDGLAIVTVKNDSCGGCNMFVPPQTINLIKMFERIITCEVCNRILYIDEGA